MAERLSEVTASLMVVAAPLIESAGLGCESERLAKLNLRPQTEDHANYARMLKKEDFVVDWWIQHSPFIAKSWGYTQVLSPNGEASV